MRGVEHPDVGAADATERVLRIHRTVLPTVRGGDEGAVVQGTTEHEIARLIADQQRPHDACRDLAHIDDTDAV